MSNYTRLLDLIDQAEASHQGYDQGERWSFLDKTNRRIIPNMEADCSAMTSALVWLAGYPFPEDHIKTGKTNYTGNADELYVKAGFKPRSVRRQSVAKIQSSTDPGDVLLGDGHIMIKARNGQWFSMNIDENGRIAGGKRGEQNPNESSFRPLWARSGGWLTVFEAPDKDGGSAPAASATKDAPAESGVLQIGSQGEDVRTMQRKLVAIFPAYAGTIVASGGADGIYGDGTAAVIREFQKRTGLVQDGIVGPLTKSKLAQFGVTF